MRNMNTLDFYDNCIFVFHCIIILDTLLMETFFISPISYIFFSFIRISITILLFFFIIYYLFYFITLCTVLIL